MARADVSLAQMLDQILRHDQPLYIPLNHEEKILASLREKIVFLQGFLDNYSHEGGDQTVQSVRDAAYQAQNIIEYHIYDQSRSHYKYYSRVVQGFWQIIYRVGKVWLPTNKKKYERDLVNALERIDSIVEEVRNLQIQQVALDESYKMVGFDEDLIEIKGRLCRESSKLKVIPIVGMGGIGKTTLARNVFDDSLVAYHFHVRAWVTISQEYRLPGILLALLDSLRAVATTDFCGETKHDEVMEYLYRSLKGRTYLIVMDDMWSTEAWDDLRQVFPDDNNGSRIVITTRLTEVAEYASWSPIHQMHFLDEDESWNLLRGKVFLEHSCPGDLEKIGRIIAANCGGLPLAVSVVAGILTKVGTSKYRWKNIAKDVSSAVATVYGSNFSKILDLSYNHLPSHLKPCFLYMGCFPEDCIRVSKLIKLWVAEGLIVQLTGSKSLEEAAYEYLEDLVRRNLVLPTRKRSNDKIRSCRVHHLLRDLCLRKAEDERVRYAQHKNYCSFWQDAAAALCCSHRSTPGSNTIKFLSFFLFSFFLLFSSLFLLYLIPSYVLEKTSVQ